MKMSHSRWILYFSSGFTSGFAIGTLIALSLLNRSMNYQPPTYDPLTPISVSERWFPKGRKFGLYECGGRVAPNVTSILGWKFPFDKAKWKKSEPDIDHDAVTRESAKRGTAVHLAMEKWLQSEDHTPVEEHLQWINPLQSLVSRASKTLAC